MVTSVTSKQHGYGDTTRCSNQWSPPLHLNNMAMEPPQGVVINGHICYI